MIPWVLSVARFVEQASLSFLQGVVKCVECDLEIKWGGRLTGKTKLRSLLHEVLERRELLASDSSPTRLDLLPDEVRSNLAPAQHSRAQQRLELALRQSEFAAQAPAADLTTDKVLNAVAFAKLNFAPRAVESFKRSSTDLSQLQPQLLGHAVGASLTWNRPAVGESKLGSAGMSGIDSQQLEKLAFGSIIADLTRSSSLRQSKPNFSWALSQKPN